MEMLPYSIGIGLVAGLLFSEGFGLPSCGLIVPGYIALYLTSPKQLVMTMGVAFATLGLVRLFSSFIILFGRRRTALMLLIGFVLGMLVRRLNWPEGDSVEVIGYLVPGLIAVWMDRQTILSTLASLTIVSVVVRLILILTV